MDSTDSLTEGTPGSMYQYLADPWIATVSMDSTDTLTEGTPWFFVSVPSKSLDWHGNATLKYLICAIH